jgi:peptide deformylase
MAVLPITVLGAPILRQETVPVEAVTPELLRLADDMIDTMRAASGVGLAAPQVGRTERLCVVEVDDRLHVLFNPEIVEEEGTIRWEEGCLSIPEVFGWVERSARVKVRAIGRDGEPVEVEGTELMAVCLQHEIDHLHGKLFLDHLSFLKRRQALAAWDGEKGKYPGLLRILTPADAESGERDRASRDGDATGSAEDDERGAAHSEARM